LHIFDVEVRETTDEVRSHIGEVIQNGKSDFETLQRTKQGEIRNVHVTAQIVEILGQPVYYCTWQDITERKQAEEKLRISEVRYRSLFEDSPIPIWEEDFSLVKAEFERLRQAGVTDFSTHWRTHPDEFGVLPGLIRIHEINQASVNVLGGKSKDQIFKNLPYYFTEETMRVFEDEMVALAEGQTRFCGEIPLRNLSGERAIFDVALTVQPGYEDTLSRVLFSFQDITSRRQAEEALRASEEKFSKAFLASPDSVIISDLASGRYLDVNESFLRDTGYEREEIIGFTSLERNIWATPEDRTHLVAGLQERGFVRNLEAQYRRKSGEVRDALVSAEVIELGLEGKHLLAVVRDITERKQAEQALRFSEAKWRSLFETCPVGIALGNTQGKLLDISPAYLAQLGYTHDEMAKKRYQDITPPKWHAQEAQNVAQLKATGLPLYFEKEHIRKDGTVFPVALTGWVIRDESGAPSTLGVFVQDISERKQAEETLSENRIRIEMALKGANAAMWDWNIKTGETVFNERWAEILGYTLKELEPISIQTWINLCHSDDLKVSNQLLQRHFAGETDYYECEARMKHRNGSWVWVIDRGRVMEWDTDCTPLRMFGTHLDITELKREERYTQARLRLANLSYETLDMDTLMRTMLDEAEALTDSQIGFFHFIDDDQNTIRLQTWSTNTLNTLCTAEGKGQHYPVAQAGVWADGIRSGEPCIYNDYASLPRRRELPEGHAPVTRLISLPIKRNNLIVAAIGVGNKPSDYNEHDLEMVKRLAEDAFDIVLRKRAEQALHESEEKYRGLLESLDSVVASVDINGVFLYMNDTAAGQLGGVPVQFIGKTMYELFPKYAASLQMRDIQTVVNEDQGMVIENPSLVNGKPRWYRTSIQPLHEENGQVVSVLINSTDIHELKAVQQELQELNRTLEEKVAQRTAEVQDLYDNAPTGYHSLDANGNFVLVNQTELNWLGYDREEMIGHAAWEFMTEESRGIFRENFPLFHQRGWMKDLELEFINRDGSILPVSLNETAIRDKAGNFTMSRSTIFDITERKQAENELKRNINFTSALLNSVPTPVFYKDKEGRYLGCNRAFTELMGRTSEEIFGKQPHQIWTTEYADIYQQKDVDLMQSREIQVYESTVKDKDGNVRPVIFVKNAFLDESGKLAGLVGAFVDITERKEAERALRESEEQNRLLFDESPVPIALLDEVGHIIHANRAYEQLTGIPRSELYGKTSVELGLVDAQVVNRLTEAMLQSMSNHENFAIVEHSLTSSDGTRRIVESHVYLLPIKSINHILVTTNDISMHKQAEETLLRANVELERAMSMKDEFLATMSHELRTPLTGILGLSEALQMEVYGGLNDRQVKTVENIENSGRHLLALINDVLDLSKVEAGKLELQIERCSLEEICQASLHLTKGMAHQKQQYVNYSAPIAPIILDVDARRIKQVLVNLFSNAIKFTPENGELGLTIEPDKQNCQVRLIVWDKGIGIKTENLSKLFQAFTQIDGSLAREYTGTGLGLALVRRLVELHNGGVEVESVFGEGSRFIVTLPWTPQAVQVGLPAAGDPEESRPETVDENSSLPMILVADDNQVLLDMLGDFLETQKYRTAKVQSGQQLLEKIACIEPDVILMDIQMPGMDGLEAIRRVRNHKDAVIASAIIIAVTALAMPGDRERCLDAGANEYMSKPVNLKKLVAVIQDLTGDG
jgi:PAS domain S-box-containing protein